jgi:uncharacterized protein (DUF1919 family)
MKFKTIFKNFCERTRVYKYSGKAKKISENVSVICNDCIAGTMYHALKKEFLSPTINLFFTDKDFLIFCQHLPVYLSLQPREDTQSSSFPIGFLGGEECGVPLIHIYFLHYKSFKQAAEAWTRRAKRVNNNKIFILINAGPLHPECYRNKKEFFELPYQTALLTNEPEEKELRVYHLSKFFKFAKPALITRYTFPLGSRAYDEFDFPTIVWGLKKKAK